MSKKIIIFLILVMLQTASASTGAAFLDNGASARSEALGRAFTAVADDLDAFYYNPAGYALQNQTRVNSMGTKINNVYDVYYLGGGEPLGIGYGALNYYVSRIGDIPKTGYDATQTNAADRIVLSDSSDNFEYSSQAIFLSYAFRVSDLPFWQGDAALSNLTFGFNIKSIREALYENSASGTGLDVGLLYGQGNWRVGFAVLNLVEPQMVWDTDSGHQDPVLRKQKLGVAYQFNESLLLAVDLTIQQFESLTGLGVEYQLNENFALRLGSYTGSNMFGLGLNYNNLNLDYVFVQPLEGLMENTHKVSLGYVFGPETENKAKLSSAAQPPVQQTQEKPREQQAAIIPPIKNIAPVTTVQPESSTKNTVSAAQQVDLLKKNFIYADGQLKCYYRLANRSAEPVWVKGTLIVLDKQDKVVAKKADLTYLISPQAEVLLAESFNLPKKGTYKVKAFLILNDQETLNYVDLTE